MADRLKGITIEINGDATGLSKALAGVNKSISETQGALRDVNRLLKLDPGNSELLAQKQRLLKDAIEETKKKLEQLKEASKEAEKALANGDMSQAQFDALQREIIDTEEKLKSLEKQANKSYPALEKIGAAGKQFQKVGGEIEKAGKAIMPVSAAVAGIGAAAVKTTADFDSSMSKVGAISGASAEDMALLRDKAREMGSQTKFSASEAADAMTFMAMAGWKTTDMMAGIGGVMDLAAASGADLATTSDIVTDAMTAFGMSTEETGRFVDVIAAASNNANTNVEMLGESFKYAAPVAGALGYNVEDVATALGLMANSGIKSSQAGTALRGALSRLAKPTKTTANYMAKYGISLTDSQGKMKPLMKLMEELRDIFGNLEEAEQAEAAAGLFGQEAMAGWLAIVNASEQDFAKLSGAISDSEGTAKKMAATMQDNLTGQLTILKSALEEAAISIGDRLVPKIRSLVTMVQEWVAWFNSLGTAQKDMIVNIGLAVAAIGPLLIVIGKVVIGIGQLMTSLNTIHGALAAFGAAGGPVLAVAAALGVIATAFITAKLESEAYQEQLSTLDSDEQAHVDTIDALAKSYDEIEGRRTAAINSISAEADHQQSLLERLMAITDENGRVKEGYEQEAAVIAGQLSEALGTEIKLTDGQIENYKELCQHLDQVIQKKQAEALIEANRGAYTEAIKNQTDAYMAYKDTQADVAQTQREIAAASAEAEQMAINLANSRKLEAEGNVQAAQASGNYSAAMTDAQERVKGLQEQLAQQNDALATAEEVMVNYATIIKNQNDLMAATVTGDQEQIRQAVENAKNSFITAETGTRESLERQLLDYQTKFAEMRAAVEQGAPGITQAQVDEMERMVMKSSAELAKLPGVTTDAISSAAGAISENTTLSETGTQIGADFDAGLAGGIEENAEQINTAAATAAGEAENGARDATQTHSPSVVAFEIGADFIAGLVDGIAQNAEQVYTAVETVATTATETLRSNLANAQAATASYQAETTSAWGAWSAGLVSTLTSSLNNINNVTTSSMLKLYQTVKTKIEETRRQWETSWKAIKDKHRSETDEIQRTNTEAMTKIVETVRQGMEDTATTTAEKLREINDNVNTSMTEMVESIRTATAQVEPAFREGFEPAVQYLEELKAQATVWGHDFMDNYIAAIRDKFDDLADACSDAADIVSDYMECSRPDKGAMHTYPIWGKDFMMGYAESLEKNSWRVTDQMIALTDKMAAVMTGAGASKKTATVQSHTTVNLDGKVLASVVNEELGVVL